MISEIETVGSFFLTMVSKVVDSEMMNKIIGAIASHQ